MFTGLVEEIGTVESVALGPDTARITISSPHICEDTEVGDSVAVNGVCLTVAGADGNRLTFEAVPETLDRSSLGSLADGDRVNLERALAVGQRLGGHFVQGHVDGLGELAEIRRVSNAVVLTIRPERDLMRYMVTKGSVALDGISLTLANVEDDRFTVWIIPHTWENTTLSNRKVGDSLNIEVDLIARHVERLLAAREDSAGLTMSKLAAAGFID